MPTVLIVAVAVLVAVLLYARRLARLGALQLVKDAFTSVALLIRWIYFGALSFYRLVTAEVRSW